MSHTSDCLEHIIGFTDTECECLDPDGKPLDAAESDSGVLISDLEGFNFNWAEAAADCQHGSLWDTLEKARQYAIRKTRTDLYALLREKAHLKRSPLVNQYIGNPKKTSGSLISLNNTYHGLVNYMADVVGGTMTVHRIGLAFNQTETFDVFLVNDYTETVINTWTVTSQANTVTWFTLPTPEVLSLKADGPDNQAYYFLFTPVNGMKAMNIRIDCNCGGKFHPWYKKNSPTWESDVNKAGFAWADYLMAAGTKGDVSTNRENWVTSNETQGLLLDVSLSCNLNYTLCPNGESPNYEADNIAKVLAHTINYAAGEWLMEFLLSSDKLNRYTMMDGDRKEVLRKKYAGSYGQRLQWLGDNLSLPENLNTYSDCFTCRNTHGFKKHTILV